MKKIGIVTPFTVPNYGTKLQAYAISNYIASICSESVEIINYNPSRDKRFVTLIRKILSIKLNIARLRKLLNKRKIECYVDPMMLKKRNISINAFDKLYVLSKPISSFVDLQQASKEYGCLICGSDQIWLPGNLRDKYYTLEFNSDSEVKKGSYAASLGVEKIAEKDKNAYKAFLSKLDFISIRESVGKEILENISPNKLISWVCDPTFLLSKDQWLSLEQKPAFMDNLGAKYVFCYFLGLDETPRKTVYEYAKKKGFKILSVANFKGFCQADVTKTDVQLYDLSVNEFLYLINHAEFVCTDSMHATIFSIIFENNFATFERFNKKDADSRNSRIYSLLHVMGLESRLVESDASVPGGGIDYNVVRSRKNAYIEKSKIFIEKEILPCL